MAWSSYLLLDVIKQPERLEALTLKDWNLLIPQTRHALLLGKLQALIDINDLSADLPAQPLNHTHSGQLLAQKQRQSSQWEIYKLREALGGLGMPVLLLKGAAYIAAQLPISEGRFLSDIDILVKKEKLDEVERTLRSYGWMSNKEEGYDQRYYREWMHEIPPMRHMMRGSFLDVHHTILPPTAKYKPDPAKIMAEIREISSGVYTLSPVDMVIHSATHLFHEGDFDHGLRDILDLHGLLSHFGEAEYDFWESLVPRAVELDLINPLYYALHYCSLILNTAIPTQVLQQAKQGKPNAAMSGAMDWLFMRALRPDHPSCDLAFTGLARWLLYIRSHYLRMPLYLLIPHLVRKAWMRRVAENKQETVGAADSPKVKATPSRWRFWAR